MKHHEQLTFSFNGKLPKSDTRCFITYTGAKELVKRTIYSVYPDDMSELASLFIGAGGFELYAAANGVRVYGYDKFDLLVRLWNIMLTPEKVPLVAQRVDDIFPIADTVFLANLIKTHGIHRIDDDIEFAALAICMSKQSFNGNFLNHLYFRYSRASKFLYKSDPTTPWIRGPKSERILNPKYEKLKFGKGTLMNVPDWKDWQSPNISVDCEDWQDSLAKHQDALLYCDPPYVDVKMQRYYGPYRTKKRHKELVKDWEFDHIEFAEAMKSHNNGWAISYIDDPLLRELYADYDVLFLKWSQGALASQLKHEASSNKEILILKPPCRHPLAIPYRNVSDGQYERVQVKITPTLNLFGEDA